MKSRGEKAIVNTSVAIIQEIVIVICGFVLPRLILDAFGSKYNGLITSITQFLNGAVLIRAGIGGATRAALYKPLAQGDQASIDAIMSATNRFMHRVAIMLAVLIFLFASVYPFLVINEFSWFFTFSLFIVIGISTFAESMFGVTSLILLQADQRLYISSIISICAYILNTILAAVLILNGASIHAVKLASAIAFTLNPLALSLYVRRKYKVNFKVKPDNNLISQRWDAFFHQVATFVMNNTDTIVLTVFSNMLIVSVYSVYMLIANGIRQLVSNFTSGLEAAFGSMIAHSDSRIRQNFKIVEFIIFGITTIVYSCTAALILQFVSVYTAGIDDVNYIRPSFAYVLIVGQAFNCIRQPYQLVVQAAGQYRQTRNGAIVEPIINISVSIILVINFGLIGVAIGSLVATIFRTVQYATYVSGHILNGTFVSMCRGVVIAILESGIILFLNRILSPCIPTDYLGWIKNASVAFVIALAVVGVGSILFYRFEVRGLFKKLKAMV